MNEVPPKLATQNEPVIDPAVIIVRDPTSDMEKDPVDRIIEERNRLS